MSDDMDREMERMQASVEVEAPLREVYNQWTQFEEFPRFMEGVESVTQIDDTHVHWVAQIAGKRKEWDAEITQQIPDREIDWMGFGSADNRGRIVFEPVDGRTRVTLLLDYEPQGGVEKIGDALGVPQARVELNMARFKSFIEGRGRETGGWRGEVREGEVTE
jgi:uncharacterized membrane protein